MLSAQEDSADIVQFLSNYLRIPTVSGLEHQGGVFIANFARARGLHVEVLSDVSAGYNAAISLYPLAMCKPNVILQSHIDVVEAGDTAAWCYPPFSGAVADDHVWGRGTIDNKGNTAMHLFALLELAKTARERPLPWNVTVLLVSDEERGGTRGMRYVADGWLDYLQPVLVLGEGPPAINGVITSRPNRFFQGIGVASKKTLWIRMDILARDQQDHGAAAPLHYPNKTMINALHRLQHMPASMRFNPVTKRILKELGKAEKGIKGFVMRHPELFGGLIKARLRKNRELALFFSNNITITRLDNPDKMSPNVVSPFVTAYLDCRVQPEVEGEKLMRQLRHLVREPSVEFRFLTPDHLLTTSDWNNGFFKIIEKNILKHYPATAVVPVQLPFHTDCAFFRQKGIPAYSFMPVQMSRETVRTAHKPNERFPVAALRKGWEVYVDILMSLQELSSFARE